MCVVGMELSDRFLFVSDCCPFGVFCSQIFDKSGLGPDLGGMGGSSELNLNQANLGGSSELNI